MVGRRMLDLHGTGFSMQEHRMSLQLRDYLLRLPSHGLQLGDLHQLQHDDDRAILLTAEASASRKMMLSNWELALPVAGLLIGSLDTTSG